MKMNIKGLVFVGFAAAVFASAANADPTPAERKTVTSSVFTERTYEKLGNKVEAFTEQNKNSTTLYPSNAAVTEALAEVGGTVENSQINIKVNGTSAGTFTVNQATDGEVDISAVTGVTQGGQAVTVTNGVAELPADANTQYTFTSGTTAGGFVVNDGTTDTPVAVYHAQTTDNMVNEITEQNKNSTTLYPSNAALTDVLSDYDTNGEENVLEAVKLNGTALNIDPTDKSVNVQAVTGVTQGGQAVTVTNGVAALPADANTQYTFTSGTTAGGFVVNDGTTDTPVAVYHAQTTDNLTQTINSSSTSTTYPSALAVYNFLNNGASTANCSDTNPCAFVLGSNGTPEWKPIAQ